MKTHILQPFLFFCLLLSASVAAAEGIITSGEEAYRVVEGDSLLLISAKFGVDLERITTENNLDSDQPLQPGLELRVTTRKIAPKAAVTGIVVDIPGRMLYYFKAGRLEMSFAVGLGMPQWQGMTRWRTPTGGFTVTGKEQDPVWYVPESIQWKMQVQGMPVLITMPPGPDNPLGRFVLYTSMKGICIHETIWPTTVYQFRSHGCIRVLAQNIERLFEEIALETPGEMVYEPVKAAVAADGKIYLQVDPDVYGKAGDLMAAARKRFGELGVAGRVDWGKVETVVDEEAGVAEDVTGGLMPLPSH